MPYLFIYKDSRRCWGQHSLGDYVPGLNEAHERYIDMWEEAKWQLKKSRYYQLKDTGKKVGALRRGRKRNLYPTKEVYNMSKPRDIAQITRFPWFSRCWSQEIENSKGYVSKPKSQKRLTDFFPNLAVALHREESALEKGFKSRIYVPHFRSPRYIMKDEFCKNMADWAWEACRPPERKVGCISHIFYLNNFSYFDSEEVLDDIDWGGIKFLPSDLIRFEIFRTLQGFETYSDFFRMFNIAPIIMDYVGVKMTHKMPSSHRYTGYLKKIGLRHVQAFFDSLVLEARDLGLILDKVHLWDGQFHETWLKKDKKRKDNLPQFYGGTYNHNGKKVGIGVYESTVFDWNGYCTIPIYTKTFCGNRNENPAVRKTALECYKQNTVPDMFLADRGPSGIETQELLVRIGTRPIIPLTSNSKKNVIVTSTKEHRFHQSLVGSTSDNVLEKVYNIRTRVEEHYNLHDNVFNLSRIHGCGEELTKMSILFACCLGVLVPLTAYKIGRPDLMWSPSLFKEQPIHPERIFPNQYEELNGFRWDDTVCVSPLRYQDYIAEKMRAFQKSKN